jgi:hypothetical protein
MDLESAEMIKNVEESTSGKDEAASTETKRMTREEKRQAKIRNIERKRLKREERNYTKNKKIQRWHMNKKELCITLWQRASYRTGNRYSPHKRICGYPIIT